MQLALQLCNSCDIQHLTILDGKMSDTSELANLTSIRSLSLIHCKELKNCDSLRFADHIQKLEIKDCAKIKDFSFLEQMPNLKSIYLDSRNFTAEDGFRLHEKTGAVVYICHLRDLDDETKKKLGIAHTPKTNNL